jgi:WD40 repeat protein
MVICNYRLIEKSFHIPWQCSHPVFPSPFLSHRAVFIMDADLDPNWVKECVCRGEDRIHEDLIRDVKVSADGSRLVASSGSVLSVWDIHPEAGSRNAGATRFRLNSHCISISPNGRYFAVGGVVPSGSNGVFRDKGFQFIIDIDGDLLQVYSSDKSACHATCTVNGEFIFGGCGTYWHVLGPELRKTDTYGPYGKNYYAWQYQLGLHKSIAAFHWSKEMICAVSYHSETNNHDAIFRCNIENGAMRVLQSVCADSVAVAPDDCVFAFALNQAVSIASTNHGELIQSLPMMESAVVSLHFWRVLRKTYLVIVCLNGEIETFSFDGRVAHPVSSIRAGSPIMCASISLDGSKLATGHRNGEVWLWRSRFPIMFPPSLVPEYMPLLKTWVARNPSAKELSESFLHLCTIGGSENLLQGALDLCGDGDVDVRILEGRRRTPLLESLFAGSMTVSSWLMRHGARLDAKDVETDDSILHAVAASGNRDLTLHVLGQCPAALLMCKNRDGKIPAHVAAECGHEASLMVLVDAYAGEQQEILNERDNDGATLMHYAVKQKMKPVIEYFLSLGGDPTMRDRHGITAITAAEDATIRALLLRHVATKVNLSSSSSAGKSPTVENLQRSVTFLEKTVRALEEKIVRLVDMVSWHDAHDGGDGGDGGDRGDRGDVDSASNSEKLKAMERIVSDHVLCVACCDRFRNAMIMPCQHVSLCMECAARVAKCPICRVDVEKVLECRLIGGSLKEYDDGEDM